MPVATIVMIQRIRRKIDDPQAASLITTRRGEDNILTPLSGASHDS
jgi:hypothetical protein